MSEEGIAFRFSNGSDMRRWRTEWLTLKAKGEALLEDVVEMSRPVEEVERDLLFFLDNMCEFVETWEGKRVPPVLRMCVDTFLAALQREKADFGLFDEIPQGWGNGNIVFEWRM